MKQMETPSSPISRFLLSPSPSSSPSPSLPNRAPKSPTMSLGKRPRPPNMRRTTSQTEFSPDLLLSDPNPDPNPARASSYLQRHPHPKERQRVAKSMRVVVVMEEEEEDVKAVEAAEFLRACGLCKRRLGAGRDTFMYRGDAAFCSLECREKKIRIDKRKEECSLSSLKSKAPQPKAGTEGTGSSETVAAA